MREIPREEFVPPESRVLAYRDEPIQIGYGQTISQPYMTALMARGAGAQGNGDGAGSRRRAAGMRPRCWARWRRA